MAEETITEEKKEEPETITVEGAEFVAPVEENPTRKELVDAGFNDVELKAAEDLGRLKKEISGEEGKKEEEKKEEKKTETPASEKKEEGEAPKPHSSLPDFKLDEKGEENLKKIFGDGTPVNGIYFRMKTERRNRQKAEALGKEKDTEIATLKAQIAGIQSAKPAAELPTDAEGNVIDPENQPVTMKTLKAKDEAEASARADQNAKAQERMRVLTTACEDQEEYSRSIHDDFEAVMETTKKIIANSDTIFTEKREREKFSRLANALQEAASTADKIDVDGYTASEIAYEIGQLRPDYGKTEKKKETGSPKDPKADGGHTSEAMERIKKNTQRASSSAAVQAGSGPTKVPVEEVTVEMLTAMNSKTRQSFQAKHPAKFDELMRG